MKKTVSCLWNHALQPKKAVIILAVLAAASGIFWSHNSWCQPADGDGVLYNKTAINILENGRFASSENVITSLTEPLYPLFLSGVYLIFGRDNFDAVRIVQLLFFIGITLLIYWLAIRVSNLRAAFFICLGVLLCFPLAEIIGHFLRETFFTFLVVALTFALFKAGENNEKKWFIAAGVLLGLSVLLNAVAEFLVFFIILGFVILNRQKIFSKDLLVRLLLFLLFFLLTLSPWVFRSWREGKIEQPSLRSGLTIDRKVETMKTVYGASYGKNFIGQFLGYYFVAEPNFIATEFLEPDKTAQKFWGMINEGFSPEEIDSLLIKENLLYIAKNPHKFLAITFLDFLQFNNASFINPIGFKVGPMQNLFIKGTHPEIPPAGKVAILIILRLFYWAFVGFVVYGLALAIKEWRKFIWILLIILYFNLVYSAVFGLARYAIPIYPFYILLFVVGVKAVWEKWLANRLSKVAVIAEG